MAFHILGTRVPSSLFNAYDPATPTRTTVYGPSQFGWNFPSARLAVFLKTLLKTRSPSLNVHGFTHLLYRFFSLCWYDAIHTAIASRSSSTISRSLVTASALTCPGIPIRNVGIQISMGIIAPIPYVRANDNIPIGFRLVVL